MKKELGQFYTRNSKYIIGNLIDYIPKDACIIDPFAGEWDLINLFDNKKIAYDISPKNDLTIKRDTLNYPPDYKYKWVITNPPYLARNKNKDKTLYDKYDMNDLYKISLKTIMGCDGGIIIIPLNFFSDQRTKLRDDFLSQYKIDKLNIFEETVFSDTTYTVCSFAFHKQENEYQYIDTIFYPNKNRKQFLIEKKYNYKIGGDFIHEMNKYKNNKIQRLVKKSKTKPNSNLYLRCTDSGSDNGKISLIMKDKHFYAKESDRTFATIVLPDEYNLSDQIKICDEFNYIINNNREKYNSLFLTNYRNSTKSYARKRITLSLSYNIIEYIIANHLHHTNNNQYNNQYHQCLIFHHLLYKIF